VAVADGAKGLGSGIEIAFFRKQVENAVLVDVFRIEGGVFHVRVVNGRPCFFRGKLKDFERDRSLQKRLAENRKFGADFFAGSFAGFSRVRDCKRRSWGAIVERRAACTPVFAGVFGRASFPVGTTRSCPLPVLHLGVFGRPAVSDSSLGCESVGVPPGQPEKNRR